MLSAHSFSVCLCQCSSCLSLICLFLTWLSWFSSTPWPGKILPHHTCSLFCVCIICLCLLCLHVRDVLTVCLSIPRWIYRVTEANKDRLSQLEPSKFLPLWVKKNSFCRNLLIVFISPMQKLGFVHQLNNRLIKWQTVCQVTSCVPYRYDAVCVCMWEFSIILSTMEYNSRY